VKIVAHGVVCARLDPARDEARQFEISEGTKLLEVQAEEAGVDLTLATHWIDYTECNGIATGEYTIALMDKRELVFNIVPAGSEPNRKAEPPCLWNHVPVRFCVHGSM
jgi:hypothetical protein